MYSCYWISIKILRFYMPCTHSLQWGLCILLLCLNPEPTLGAGWLVLRTLLQSLHLLYNVVLQLSFRHPWVYVTKTHRLLQHTAAVLLAVHLARHVKRSQAEVSDTNANRVDLSEPSTNDTVALVSTVNQPQSVRKNDIVQEWNNCNSSLRLQNKTSKKKKLRFDD